LIVKTINELSAAALAGTAMPHNPNCMREEPKANNLESPPPYSTTTTYSKKTQIGSKQIKATLFIALRFFLKITPPALPYLTQHPSPQNKKPKWKRKPNNKKINRGNLRKRRSRIMQITRV
jgi:hypothetical protein